MNKELWNSIIAAKSRFINVLYKENACNLIVTI